jgi:hypothetical protein
MVEKKFAPKSGKTMDRGYSDIARMINCSSEWIRRVMLIERSPRTLQTAHKNKKIGSRVMHQIQRLPFEFQEIYTKHYLLLQKKKIHKTEMYVKNDVDLLKRLTKKQISEGEFIKIWKANIHACSIGDRFPIRGQYIE